MTTRRAPTRPPCPAFGLRELSPAEMQLLRILAAATHPLTMAEMQTEMSGRLTDELLWLLEVGLVTQGTMTTPFARAGRPPTWYFPTRAGERLAEQVAV